MSDLAAPGFRQLLREARAPLQALQFLLQADGLELPRGDGHAVLLLPPFALGDEAFKPMARSLRRLGYAVYGWDEGRNLGLRARILERLLDRLEVLAREHGGPLSLIGWSAGGLYARELARLRPAQVRRVFTLGSPIRPHARGQLLARAAQRGVETVLEVAGHPSFAPDPDPPPVPCTALHSRSDGVVAWRAALESVGPGVENLAVGGSHLGFGVSLEVLQLIAERLARPAGQDVVPVTDRQS